MDVVEDADVATHSDPVWRDKTNYIVRVDLAQDGMPGKFEQLWTRTRSESSRHELCCIPYFTYGLSLGDQFELTSPTGAYRVVGKSGHRTIRVVVTDDRFKHERHSELHASIADGAGCLVEFRGHALGYGAIDIADASALNAVLAVLNPLAEQNLLMWEWADPPTEQN